MENPKYRNEEWLKKRYEALGSIYKMAEEAGCHPRTIHSWMTRYGISMHGTKGIKRSEDAIRRSVEARNGKPGPMAGKHHSQETKMRMSVSRKGEKNANWKGGATERIRAFRRSKEYVHWVEAVKKKACGKCELCGSTEGLQAHHIVSLHQDFSKALDVSNGQLLCESCHRKIHGGLRDE